MKVINVVMICVLVSACSAWVYDDAEPMKVIKKLYASPDKYFVPEPGSRTSLIPYKKYRGARFYLADLYRMQVLLNRLSTKKDTKFGSVSPIDRREYQHIHFILFQGT